jgi:phosphatidylethanolamine/phosphatidyl-N-methylethanolamine N-methyltransferase
MPDSKRKFWKQFLKSRREIGSVTPSSRHLTKGIVDKLDFSSDRVVIELGPGTGVFTQAILDKLSPNSKLIVIELNDEMFNLLESKINDERMLLIHGSAAEMQQILVQNNIQKVDYVVSSLPLSVMPDEVANQIFSTSVSMLGKHGKFIQFMYSLVLKEKLEKYFDQVNTSFVLLNFPPAFVFECHNLTSNE